MNTNPQFQILFNKLLHYSELIGLIAIAVATNFAMAREAYMMAVLGKVTLTDLLLMFLFLEILVMVNQYVKAGQLPVRFPLYIAIVPLARELILKRTRHGIAYAGLRDVDPASRPGRAGDSLWAIQISGQRSLRQRRRQDAALAADMHRQDGAAARTGRAPARAGHSGSRPVRSAGVIGMWKRLGWMVLIWSASVAALGVVALLLRALMHAAGMR